MSDLNIQTIGNLCNSLNANEARYLDIEEDTSHNRNMAHYLGKSREIIWALWNTLNKEGLVKTCPVCGLSYYTGDECSWCNN